MVVAEPEANHGGRMRGEFRYSAEFLDWSGAFALDPFHLSLGTDPIRTTDPATGIHAVLEDSLPDSWGRAIMCRRYDVPRSRQRAAYLLEYLGAEAMGALAYTRSAKWWERSEEAGLPNLADLMMSAERYESDPDAPVDDLMHLFKAGSPPGGARPKVLVKEKQIDYLAKFPSLKDTFDMVALEAATLATARDAGIEVPEFYVQRLGERSALMVERFDVTQRGGRNHLLSMQTLLGAGSYYFLGYGEMADVVRRLSDRPGKDLRALFRQAVFNALIGNTDDHLKNFAMLHGAEGWQLTPAYDLLPDVGDNREHVLHFGSVGTVPSMDSLQSLGRVFGISPKKTRSIIDEVRQAVAGFPAQCANFAVPDSDQKVMSGRMSLLKTR